MEKSEIDCENYWSSSTADAFSFDDEDSDASMFANFVWDSAIEDSTFEDNQQEAINISIKDVVSEKTLGIILQEQSLDECIISKGLDLEKEVKLLRRQIQSTLYSPDPEVTAYQLLQGKCPPLGVFKSLKEKQLLLDTIIQLYGGGDGTIGVILFLKRTLNQENFFQVFKDRSKALEHFISYLRSYGECEENLSDFLHQFNRYQDSFIMRLCVAMEKTDKHIRKHQIKELVHTNSNGLSSVNLCLREIAQNTLKLLEFVEKEQKTLDNMVNINSTPIEALYVCCQKCSNWKDESLVCSTSPFRFAFEHKISPAQFEWTALNERALSKAYADLERIFEHLPTWHPIKNKRFHISFPLEIAVKRLHELRAPTSVLYLFLSKISDLTEKLELSKRVQCHKATIDALFALKDLSQLMVLREKLPDRSEEQFYCDKTMKNLQGKRWSTDQLKIKL